MVFNGRCALEDGMNDHIIIRHNNGRLFPSHKRQLLMLGFDTGKLNGRSESNFFFRIEFLAYIELNLMYVANEVTFERQRVNFKGFGNFTKSAEGVAILTGNDGKLDCFTLGECLGVIESTVNVEADRALCIDKDCLKGNVAIGHHFRQIFPTFKSHFVDMRNTGKFNGFANGSRNHSIDNVIYHIGNVMSDGLGETFDH